MTDKKESASGVASTDEEANSAPATSPPAPLVYRILISDWYPKVEYWYFNLSVVVLWSVIFLPSALPKGTAHTYQYWMYWIFCFLPHAGLYLPLQWAIFHRFTFKEVLQLMALWKLHVLEQVLLVLVLAVAIPIGLDQQSVVVVRVKEHLDGFWISVPISAAVLMHLMAFFLIEGKRTLVRRTMESDHAETKLSRSWIRQSVKVELPHQVLQQMKESYQRRQDDPQTDQTSEDDEEQTMSAPVVEEKEPITNPFFFLFRLYWKFPCLSGTFFVTVTAARGLITILPLTIGQVVAAFSEADETTPSWDMMRPGLILVGNTLLIPIVLSVSSHSAFRIGSNIEIYLKQALFQSVCGLQENAETHSKTLHASAGHLTSRFSDDIGAISYFMSECMHFDIMSGTIGYIASVVVLATLDWKMAYFYALCVPAMVVVNLHAASANKSSENPRGGLLRRFQNLVGLRRTLHLYQSGDFAWSKTSSMAQKDFDQLRNMSTRQATFVATVAAATNLYIALLTTSLLFSAISNVQNGMGSQVELVSVGLGIIAGLFGPVSQLSRAGRRFLEAIPALHRVESFMDSDHDGAKPNKCNNNNNNNNNNDDDDAENLSSLVLDTALTVDKVKFQYPGSSKLILKGVDAEFEIGKYYCIIGGSGAGKSTLANILTRELQETEGSVLVDGEAVSDVGVYRDRLGIVLQGSSFFDGSIKDNILLGRPSASDEEVQLAIEQAQCADFVSALPNGLDTELGEDVNLSGGQAQRISLARALVRHPKILFLDECTSALDQKTQQEVIDTITNLAHSGSMAVISITHRLETTDPCDEIYVLKDGIVIERGTPKDLNVPGTLFSNIRGSAKKDD